MPAKITDHEARAVARLAMQFRGQPRLTALVEALAAQAQVVENGLWQIYEETLDTAVGVGLDVLGAIVVQPREDSVDDDDYRLRIKAKAVANRSNGRFADILQMFAVLLRTAWIREIYPAAIVTEVLGATTTAQATSMARLLAKTRAAGVGSQLVYGLDADALVFTIPIAGMLSAPELAGAVSLTCDAGIEGLFPAVGSLLIDDGLATEETVAYYRVTGTTFDLVAATTQNHGAGAALVLTTTPGLGLGDSTDPAAGGTLAGVLTA